MRITNREFLMRAQNTAQLATRLPGANPRPARRVKETLIPALPLARTRNMKGDAGDSSDQVGVGPKNAAKMY
jgi:hypothetical protein